MKQNRRYKINTDTLNYLSDVKNDITSSSEYYKTSEDCKQTIERLLDIGVVNSNIFRI